MLRGSLSIRQFRQQNCFSYVLFDRPSLQAMVIDPRMDLMDDYRSFIADNGLRVLYCADTRLQLDHLSASHLLRAETRCEIVMSIRTETPRATRKVASGEQLALGDGFFEILETPGVAPDAICLRGGDLLLTGDTLWIGATARTDLKGADARALWGSLNEVLARLPGDTLVFPGHDRQGLLFSTLAVEMRKNPAYQAGSLEAFLESKVEEKHAGLDDFDHGRLRFNLMAQPGAPGESERIGSFGGSASQGEASTGAASINVEKFRRKLLDHATGHLFIDVREASEFGESHIPGMSNIPVSELGLHFTELARAKRVYVSCLSGRRSALAARNLCYLGLDAVTVSGGLKAWLQAGFPVE